MAHRVRELPHLVRVHAETPLRPDQPPDRRHAGGVLGGILLADLDLDPAEAEREQLLDVGEQRVLVEEQVDPAAVRGNGVAKAAEQPVEGHAGLLAGEVPQRRVHRGQRELREPCAASAQLLAERLPVPADRERILADEHAGAVVVDEGDDRRPADAGRVRDAGADEAAVRLDVGDDVLDRGDVVGRVLPAHGRRQAVEA